MFNPQTCMFHKQKHDDELLFQAYLEAFGRTVRSDEATAAKAFLASQLKLYGQESRKKVWHDLLHTLMNVKEFIFIN